MKVLGLLGMVVLFASIPWLLSFSSEKLIGHQEYFIYLWIFYVFLLAFIFFYWKKNLITLNSFLTQNMVWAIFTLGSYTVVDLPKFLPPHLRQIALYLWVSFAMVFNFIWFFIDDTDHQEEDRKELLKEEKRKKKEDVRKQKEEEEMKQHYFGKRSSLIINIILYALVLLGGAYFGYSYYLDFQQRLDLKKPPVEWVPPDMDEQ